jgi:hypothetical protein
MNINKEIINSFRALCCLNRLEEAQNLLPEFRKCSNYKDSIFWIFTNICSHGYLDMAKWLFSLNEVKEILFQPLKEKYPGCYDDCSDYYDEYLLNEIFRHSCFDSNNIELAQWYYSVITETTGNILYIWSHFYTACIKEKLELAQWLHSLSVSNSSHKYLYISQEYYCEIFNDCCKNNKITSAQWLYSLFPNNSFITIENNKITNYNFILQS